MVAVETRLLSAPHRSRRALRTHRALPSGAGVETVQRLKVQYTGRREAVVGELGELGGRETYILPWWPVTTPRSTAKNAYKLVPDAPLYMSTIIRISGSGRQNKHKRHEFNFALGAHRLASERSTPVAGTESTTRLPGPPRSRPSSGRSAWQPIRPAIRATAPGLRAPNGVR